MSAIADLVRRMAEAGAPAEAIAIAVEAVEATAEAAAAAIEAKRAQAREKKRRQRAGPGAVPGQDRDSPAPVPPKVLETKVSPTPPSKTQSPNPPSPPSGALPPKKSRRCPVDYGPSETVLGLAWSLGLTEDEVAAELQRMKDHQFRDAHVDWDAAFRNWLRTYADRTGRGARGPPQRYSPSQLQAASDELAFRNVLEKLNAPDPGNHLGNQSVVVALPEARQIGSR